MKTIATITIKLDWEHIYDKKGDPDFEEAILDHINAKDTLCHAWDLEDGVACIEGDFEITDIHINDIVEPRYIHLPFCEHCGTNHTDFGCEFDDGVRLCLDCYLSDKIGSEYLYKHFIKNRDEAHLEHLRSKIKELETKNYD